MIGEDPMDLGGQTALVTGAGQGVGRAIALSLARHNAGGVAVNDFVAERADAVATEIRAIGVKAKAVPFDVCDITAVRAAARLIEEELGTTTILVNNAGMAGPNAPLRPTTVFWEEDPSHWDKYLGTNLYGVLNCCHAIIPGMVREERGRIVTITSDSGRVGEARQAVYSAAKGGAASFVRSIAKELGRYNVTSNAIALSSILPPMPDEQLDTFLNSDQSRAQLSRYVIRRYGSGEDVAGLATFLSSDAAAWITGQTYPLNGGYSFAM